MSSLHREHYLITDHTQHILSVRESITSVRLKELNGGGHHEFVRKQMQDHTHRPNDFPFQNWLISVSHSLDSQFLPVLLPFSHFSHQNNACFI